MRFSSDTGTASDSSLRAVIEYRVHKRVKEQFDAFMAGFSELIPQDLVNVFDERELEVSPPYGILRVLTDFE